MPARRPRAPAASSVTNDDVGGTSMFPSPRRRPRCPLSRSSPRGTRQLGCKHDSRPLLGGEPSSEAHPIESFSTDGLAASATWSFCNLHDVRPITSFSSPAGSPDSPIRRLSHFPKHRGRLQGRAAGRKPGPSPRGRPRRGQPPVAGQRMGAGRAPGVGDRALGACPRAQRSSQATQ